MLKFYFTLLSFLFFFIFSVFSVSAKAELPASAVDTVKIEQKDIPEGYMFGIIPEGVKGTLRSNPWFFDRAAINRLTPVIYPGGDPATINAIHMTILARSDAPYADDIVCYFLVYSSTGAAEKELVKLKEFGDLNKDRVFYSVHDNVVLLMLVDDLDDYAIMRSLADLIDKRFTEKK